ncbi:MAG: hypothetical protein H0U53_08715 [Actinobacteria bacterium]|nr:hypothetical protein [Actinomycetota bacterium]
MRSMKQLMKSVVMVVGFVLVLPATALAAPPGATVTYTPNYSYAFQGIYTTTEGVNSATASASKSGLLTVSSSSDCTTVPVCSDTSAHGSASAGSTYRAKNGVSLKAIATFTVTDSFLSGGPGTFQGNWLRLQLSSGTVRSNCRQAAPEGVTSDAPVTVVVECTLGPADGTSVFVYGSATTDSFDDIGDSIAATSRLSATLESLQIGPQQ